MSEQIIHFQKKRNYRAISKDKAVTLKYLLIDADSGQALEMRDDMLYLHGGYGSAFPKVEEALEGLEVDMITEVSLSPDEAYGEKDPDLILTVPTDAIPEAARQVGAQLDGEGPDGSSRPFRVIQVRGNEITVDGNHPLAGLNLHFRFEVLDIRNATAEEIAAGYGFRSQPD